MEFHAPIRLGDALEKRSRVTDITPKMGRSGMLCFVRFSHKVYAAGQLAISEMQTVIYRAQGSEQPAANAADAGFPVSGWYEPKIYTPLMLFQYSALSLNSHRIHYDRDYARNVEKYPSLVVHGRYKWLS